MNTLFSHRNVFAVDKGVLLPVKFGVGGGGREGDLTSCAYLWKNPGYTPVYFLINATDNCLEHVNSSFLGGILREDNYHFSVNITKAIQPKGNAVDSDPPSNKSLSTGPGPYPHLSFPRCFLIILWSNALNFLMFNN